MKDFNFAARVKGMPQHPVDAVPADAGTERHVLGVPDAQSRGDVRDRRSALSGRAHAAGQRHAGKLPRHRSSRVTRGWRRRTCRWPTKLPRNRSSRRLPDRCCYRTGLLLDGTGGTPVPGDRAGGRRSIADVGLSTAGPITRRIDCSWARNRARIHRPAQPLRFAGA